MSKLSRWATEEPVRLYVYTLLAATLSILMAYGIVDEQYEAVILAGVSAVLAVPAVEKARSKVTPYSPNDHEE